jgi:hypothetical protein
MSQEVQKAPEIAEIPEGKKLQQAIETLAKLKSLPKGFSKIGPNWVELDFRNFAEQWYAANPEKVIALLINKDGSVSY